MPLSSACHRQIHERVAIGLRETPLAMIENHHNFAWKEKDAAGDEVIVHRKGATPAAQGVLGIIPGSMATPGFIVRGKGEINSLNSASHGAGRTMSQKGINFYRCVSITTLMRLRLKWAIVGLICSFFCICGDVMGKNGGPDTANFVLVKENNGISLYERWYAFTPDQQAREIKATFNVKTDSYAAVALIKDAARGRQWNKNTKAYEIVRENEHLWFGYIQYDLPWPVSNQDCVLQYSQNDSDKSVLVEFQDADHPSFPPRKKIQRIPEISGKWIFRESDHGISVEYYISTLPSNSLPTWLTDPIIRNNLIETLTIFRTILERNR